MIVQSGWSLITVKLILIGIFIFFTSPVTSHVTANLARQKKITPVGKKIGKIL
jgi:multicomponent Na+:H+ antiporter subunit G